MYLGVDGGGTKTAFALLDADGALLARHQSGSAYYLETGLEQAAAMLRHGVGETLALAGVAPQAVSFAFFGLPAYGEDSLLQAALDALPGDLLAPARYRCGNDMLCSWAGSLVCGDGVSIIAGTGSIAYGQYGGREARAGGWGELFSDEGSAYWIAREGLNLFSRMSDWRAPRGPLYDIIRASAQLGADLDLCAEVYSRRKGERSQVAQFARLVQQAAAAGDGQAQAIFARAAEELAAIVDAVRRQLRVPAEVALPVSYSGGAFNPASPLPRSFGQALGRLGSFVLTPPVFEPVIGAALYAARCCGQFPPPDTLARLRAQCASSAQVPA